MWRPHAARGCSRRRRRGVGRRGRRRGRTQCGFLRLLRKRDSSDREIYDSRFGATEKAIPARRGSRCASAAGCKNNHFLLSSPRSLSSSGEVPILSCTSSHVVHSAIPSDHASGRAARAARAHSSGEHSSPEARRPDGLAIGDRREIYQSVDRTRVTAALRGRAHLLPIPPRPPNSVRPPHVVAEGSS